MKATTVLTMPLEEVSAKVRTGGPVDDEADDDHPVWAGVVPLGTVVGPPVPDERLRAGIGLPERLIDALRYGWQSAAPS